MNRTLLFSLVFLLMAGIHGLSSGLHAQQIPGFSYQAVARTPAGGLIQNGFVQIKFNLLDNTNTLVYSKLFSPVPTNQYGLVNLTIGKDDPLFYNVEWANRNYSMEVILNGLPVDTMQLSSVPYSEVSRIATEMVISDLNDVSSVAPNSGEVLGFDGTTWKPVVLNTGSNYSPGNGIAISSNNVISNTAPADSTDEIQVLSRNGNLIVLSKNGGSVLDQTADADADSTNEIQSLSKNGNLVTLSSVNNIGGGAFIDEVNDADADSTNELQGLSLSGNVLSLTNNASTNSITLPTATYTAGNGISISANTITNLAPSKWEKIGARIFVMADSIGIGTNSPAAPLDVRGPAEIRQRLFLRDNLGQIRIRIAMSSANGGLARWDGPNGNRNVHISHTGNPDHGFLGIYNQNGQIRTHISLADVGTGGTGIVGTFGPNGEDNAWLGYLDGYPNNGYVFVLSPSGTPPSTPPAGMYVNSLNFGVMFATIKNFFMPHPNRPGKEIWYACIEGPEAAAYERGTATLQDGEAFVSFSEHFEVVANAKTMTVILTPLNAASKGMAVVEKTDKGFRVKELMEGKGNYSFDWEVKCVRKGFEDYRVIRDEGENIPGRLSHSSD